jgi:2-hydroxy-6-oxonona-2,4-dienedioate hydrolase
MSTSEIRGALPEVQYLDMAVAGSQVPEKIAYRIFNPSGERTLVHVHGNLQDSLGSADTWALPEMRSVRVVAVDLRGFGFSSYNNPTQSHADLALDVAAVMDHLHLKHVDVAGVSTGGATVAQLAVAREDLVKKCFLVSSVPLSGFIWPKMENGAPIQPMAFVSKVEEWDTFGGPDFTKFPEEVLHGIWKGMYSDGTKCPALGSEHWALVFRAIKNTVAWKDIMMANITSNVTSEPNPTSGVPGAGGIDKLKGKVVVIHGDKDTSIAIDSVKAYVEKYTEYGIKFVPVAGGAHLFSAESPELFAKAYLEHSL